ncbi:MAG: cytochrome P450 [Actinomycetota bacterium]|nr:cytochrome P450 [Actinomycetota bacterium]
MDAPDILSPTFAADPYTGYSVLRREFPVLYHEATNSWLVSKMEDVERIFRDPDITSDNYSWQLEPVHGRTILQMEGREHSRTRNLITPAFRGSELRDKFQPVIDKNARELIDPWRMDGHVELVSQFTTHFPINVIVDMLGLQKTDHELFHRWYHSIMAFLSNLTQDPAVTEQGLRTKEELQAYMMPIIASRRADPGDDLLSVLCTAEIDGAQMSDLDVKAFVSLLLVAGGETTDKALASLMRNLVMHPDQMAAVREDRSLISAAFAETLRHSPPVHMIMRQPKVDFVIRDVTIPAGATITCLLAAANRDEDRFDHPDDFDIHRPDLDVGHAYAAAANHMAFANGRHFCVGAMLAKTEVESATNQLLDAMRDIRLQPDAAADEIGLFTRSPGALPLRFTPT